MLTCATKTSTLRAHVSIHIFCYHCLQIYVYSNLKLLLPTQGGLQYILLETPSSLPVHASPSEMAVLLLFIFSFSPQTRLQIYKALLANCKNIFQLAIEMASGRDTATTVMGDMEVWDTCSCSCLCPCSCSLSNPHVALSSYNGLLLSLPYFTTQRI